MKNKNSKTVGLLVIFSFYIVAYVIGALSVYFLRNIVTAIEWQLLIFTSIATLVVWIGSLIVKNTSVYDAYWSLTPFVMIIYIFVVNINNINIYHIVLFVVFSFWPNRLTVNWVQTFKNLEIEDWRYAGYRKKLNPFIFHVVNFLGLQFMPTVLVYMGLLPLVSFFAKEANGWSLIGSAIILAGTLLELFADISMHRHLKEGSSGEVNRKGLWKYSRHPNYFGEILIWVGSYVALLLTEPSLWYLGIGMILMFMLFEFISIPLAEAHHLKKRPDYAMYKKGYIEAFTITKAKENTGGKPWKKVFKEILDQDEQIIKVFKPNKTRFVTIRLIVAIIWYIIMAAVIFIPLILALSGILPMVDDEGVDGTLGFVIVFSIFGFFLVLALAFFIANVLVSYKKTYYAYSNKKIIIRQGFIGVDYYTLEMKMISTVLVNVGLFDKMVKPNTGTISFGSSATPIGVSNGKGGVGFSFSFIDDAYQTYREVKEVINSHRTNESKIS